MLALAVTFGNGLTVMVTTPVSVHPLASVPVTIYVVVAAGSAVGLEQFVHDSPVAGVHTYEFAPVAVIDTPAVVPWQIL
jgi:hypothetical protein